MRNRTGFGAGGRLQIWHGLGGLRFNSSSSGTALGSQPGSCRLAGHQPNRTSWSARWRVMLLLLARLPAGGRFWMGVFAAHVRTAECAIQGSQPPPPIALFPAAPGCPLGWLLDQAARFTAIEKHLPRCAQPESRCAHRPAPDLSGLLPPKESVGRVGNQAVRTPGFGLRTPRKVFLKCFKTHRLI